MPALFNICEISSIFFRSVALNLTSVIGLLNKFLREAIFLTFILLNLFSFSLIFLIKVIINELPSDNISLLSSKISEKINSSNTLAKSVNLITA